MASSNRWWRVSRASPQLWLGLAPEGTRKPVHGWRSGFWHIARAAGVPILPIAFDYPSRTITIGALFQPTADLAADLAALRALLCAVSGPASGREWLSVETVLPLTASPLASFARPPTTSPPQSPTPAPH